MKPPAGGNPGDEGNPGRGDPDAGSEVAADPDDPQAASLLDVEPDASGNGGSMASSCPECGGVLTERTEAGVIQWQCRVGHRYSPESLADAQAEGVEAALWAAIRALEDRQALLERMGRQAETSGLPKSAQSFVRRAQEAAAQAATVREAVADATRSSLQMLSDSEQVDSERRGLC